MLDYEYLETSCDNPNFPESARIRRRQIATLIHDLQDRICRGAEELENGIRFQEDVWIKDPKESNMRGGGRTRIIQDGKCFEKAGVNVSVLCGSLPSGAVKQMRANHSEISSLLERYEAEGSDWSVPFFVTGVSVVIHGHNPHVPTVHCNYRYFELGEFDKNGEPAVWWVGGGADLTPSYLYDEDAMHFHRTLKQVCDETDVTYYLKFKKWCDEYFYLKHRQEARGIGGIFFDDLSDTNRETMLKFIQECGESFNPGYYPIVKRRMNLNYTGEQKQWQQLRRGRYVEFNLIWDRGTKFGLQTPGARIESILMSLPLTSRWQYQHEPDPESEESRLVSILKTPVMWVDHE